MGYIFSGAVEKTIGRKSFIALGISKDGHNALSGLTKANLMNLLGVTTCSMDNKYDYKVLETVSSILNSAEYSGENKITDVNMLKDFLPINIEIK